MLRRRLSVSILSLAVVLPLGLGLASCMSSPATTGPVGGRLPACPDSPNCVCSQDPSPQAHIAPFALSGPAEAAMDRLQALVLAQPRTRLAESRPGYRRFEFRSRVFRFVDDVEFLADPEHAAIQVRSASRTGHSDLGVNRRRIEHLRGLWGSSPVSPP